VTVDPYEYWRAALAGEPVTISADHPQCGRYKMRKHKDAKWQPVAIFMHGGVLAAAINGVEHADPYQVWTYCADNAISTEVYRCAVETGRFPDEVPGIGDNAPPNESLFDTIARVSHAAVEWLTRSGIKDKVSGDMCANYRAQLLELRKRADAERETEKRPHIEAGRKVDAKYKPAIDCADTAAGKLRDALTVYMRAEEEKRTAAMAAEMAARAKQMRDDPIAALTSEPEPELAPVKVQAGGQRGRKTGLRSVTRYVITDYAAALAHCSDHPAVREAVEKVCCAQAKAGASVPGVEAKIEKVAA
jgi:hypothetical protein